MRQTYIHGQLRTLTFHVRILEVNENGTRALWTGSMRLVLPAKVVVLQFGVAVVGEHYIRAQRVDEQIALIVSGQVRSGRPNDTVGRELVGAYHE